MKESEKHISHFDIVVIGGGASGMMAAGTAAARGKRVCIVEKNNELGKKLKITGGGRCNITNATYDIHALLSMYGKAHKFLYTPFSLFGVNDTFRFFEERGLPLVVEAGNRAFPHTHNAHDVFRVLEKYCIDNGVVVMLDAPVERMVMCRTKARIDAIETSKGSITARAYIFATGGASHPETGSTGDAFHWLKDMGHTVTPPSPNIVPLRTAESWVHTLSGVSVDSMKITFLVDGVKKFHKTGKILFTHFGLSGPLILNSAHTIADMLHEGVVTASVDVVPHLAHGDLDKHIQEIFSEHKNKNFKNVAEYIAPHGMAVSLMMMPGMPLSDTKVHSITKEERKHIVHTLKDMRCTITGLMGMDKAVVSDGGVPLGDIDLKTMRSRLVDNLYITGDLLHINRPSGGYSLQLCWTTGWIAGSCAE
ncbi:MAG: aminoacetone oxidase family FAD-binding enzyme [Candidatus Pacebacteria bacterium]|nr:aminoacetone oxidase family FAD-binding enzyme [Candidatus Paceibacterota bacterium]MCD8508319.1 aminoacetone oxidase family FAD-binding enzyme [Candidatus Paceibacterota bacterium]MCD8564057.1 aminoacetone oxidase family FAD-binding enzyme [Candidatus Paceibacterota bacterium]